MRFQIFAGITYYPRGGAGDLFGESPTVVGAILRAKELVIKSADILEERIDWWHIYDTHEKKIVQRFGETLYDQIIR